MDSESTAFAKALRDVWFEREDAMGLLMAGTAEDSLDDNVRFAAARQVCLSIVGRTIEAILKILQLACQKIERL